MIDQNRDRPSAFPPPSWFSPRTRALFRDPLVLCLALIIVTSLFFAVFPGFDVWFSSLFYLPGGGFPAATLPVSLLLRQLAGDVVGLVVIALVFVVLLKLALPWRRSLVEPRAVIFILGTLIVGPGIVVNWIFKNHWGRPRPVSVDIFSGSHPFVPAWHMSDACTANCSFVSGEASSAIWLLVLAVLLPPAWRPVAVRILLVLAVILSLNRIAGGGHFLSDVLLAWWFTLAVMALGWRWLYTRPLVAPERFEAALTNAGLAIRRLFGAGRRPPPPTA